MGSDKWERCDRKRRRRCARVALALAVGALASVSLAPSSQAAEWPLGLYEAHEPAREIQVPRSDGAQCGNTTRFSFVFSASELAETNRVVIWMPGGGNTIKNAQGVLNTNLTSVNRIDTLLNDDDDSMTGMRNYLFMDHAANDPFIGPAHWVKLPYCTQDLYSGNNADLESYDFTQVVSLRRDICRRVGGKVDAGRCIDPDPENKIADVIDGIEQQNPTFEIEWHINSEGDFEIDDLTIGIAHQGARNIEAAVPYIIDELASEGVDFSEAEIVIAGSSAGAFGTWYNAFRVGDELYEMPGQDAELTLAPMAGGPITRLWEDQEEDIVEEQDLVEGIKYRFDYYEATVPCDFPGGEYDPTDPDRCYDTLELVDHYRSRYPELDLRIAPVWNREDPLAVRRFVGEWGPNNPEYGSKLLRFCRTVHAYGEHLAAREDVHPWTAWQYQREWVTTNQGDRVEKFGRVHGPSKRATVLVPLAEPSGVPGREPGDGLGGALAYVNAVADRDPRVEQLPPMIDHRLALIEDVDDPESGLDLDLSNFLNPWPHIDEQPEECIVEVGG